MNLKDISRSKIQETVLQPPSGNDWHILIYNKETAKIIAPIYTKTQILSSEILSMQRLELSRDALPYPAIYFVHYSKESSKKIKKDIKLKMYLKYYIMHINRIESKDKIIGDNIFYKYVDISFVCFHERTFTWLIEPSESIASLCMSLDVDIEIVDLKKEKKLKYSVREALQGQKGANNKGYLILLDRSFDLTVPLIHSFNFESIINDMHITDEDVKDCASYSEIKYLHIAETNRVLTEKTRTLVMGFKKIDEKTNINEIRKFVLQAPENIKLKQSVDKCISIAQEALNCFEKNKLSSIAELEQNIYTGFDEKGNHYGNAVEDALYLLNINNLKREYKL